MPRTFFRHSVKRFARFLYQITTTRKRNINIIRRDLLGRLHSLGVWPTLSLLKWQ